MLFPPHPANEVERLQVLRSLRLLDTPPEERFDTLTRLAARVFKVPIAVVTLVDEQRQWFKSCVGLAQSETPREIAFCAHAILHEGVFVVQDAARDGRFADNPLVSEGPRIRFYAGMPIGDGAGRWLGTLAIIDRRPRRLSGGDRLLLADLARLAELELHRIRLGLQQERDATALRQNEARLLAQETRLREADQQKDRFIATLAHELRNPLAPIRNSVAVVQIRKPADPVVTQAIEVLDRQSAHLTRLVDELLEVARITQDRLVLEPRPCRVDLLVSDAVESVRVAVQAAGHTLQVELPPAPLWVQVDPTRLVQVLSNLLDNATKYTGAGGHIALRVRLDGERVVFVVEDNGVGIAPDEIDRVFEPFTQDSRSIGRRSGGLGIGLALARRLVTLHGGVLKAHSAGLQQGARFVVELPRLAEPHAVPPGAPRLQPPGWCRGASWSSTTAPTCWPA